MAVVLSFTSLCILLVLGKVLRVKIPLLQKLYLPAAVIGGLLGLLIIHFTADHLPQGVTAGWDKLPGFLINICFACLFLGVKIPKLSKIWEQSGPQLAYGQIVAWGQYVVGLGISIILIAPLFNLPDFFGVIIPVGFEGGHGTAAGLAELFRSYNWAEGLDYALTSATLGIISAIAVGTVLVNWAVRRGYTKGLRRIENIPESNVIGIYDPAEQPSAGKQTVSSASVDTFALHIGVVGIAIFIGYLLKTGLAGIESFFPAMRENGILSAFPLFPLSMIGGLLVQLFISRVLKMKSILDREVLQRLSGTALDFLVVSAIAMINLSLVSKQIIPLLIIALIGVLWNVFCVIILARRLLPDAWFERAIAEMGQSMGVTATGLLLLRVVDAEQKTPAYSAFGYKQLLHEPIMGGGIWTSLAFPLCVMSGSLTVFIIALCAVAVWLFVWFLLFRNKIVSAHDAVF
ncbi:MAG: sodium/glutamate symporter [Candidatus Marinimicrobia bacterium]|nr:sodium/glutamate symporter [Candidatus Neomarinimicrobiota bacterium]